MPLNLKHNITNKILSSSRITESTALVNNNVSEQKILNNQRCKLQTTCYISTSIFIVDTKTIIHLNDCNNIVS